jgi:mRNA interferase MazF
VDKRRPAVVVSNDGANSAASRLGRGVVTVVPVSSSIERTYPFQVLLEAGDTGPDRTSKAQAEQIRSVAIERTYYYLYVILDIFSRYVVGWMRRRR